jgi:hypothetical protein
VRESTRTAREPRHPHPGRRRPSSAGGDWPEEVDSVLLNLAHPFLAPFPQATADLHWCLSHLWGLYPAWVGAWRPPYSAHARVSWSLCVTRVGAQRPLCPVWVGAWPPNRRLGQRRGLEHIKKVTGAHTHTLFLNINRHKQKLCT